jgi:protein-L-isoaspartate(D-aspartate) O-methyltransferase
MSAELPGDPFYEQRLAMVVHQLRRRGVRDERVLQVMQAVPRHEFVAPEFWGRAYADEPIPIAEEQTVSQPYIVAFMLEALEIAPEHRVLEIGTGTGYQAALLGKLAHKVTSVERHRELADKARENLTRLAYSNVAVVHGDGTQGWPADAPYERIIVAAAAPRIPPALWEQLVEGGRIILPLGSPEVQEVTLVRKENGQSLFTRLEGCRFVPLIGEEGFHQL